MSHSPEQFSSFCYLDQRNLHRVESFARTIEQMRVEFSAEFNMAHDEEDRIYARPVATPKRNILESGRIHDERINEAALQWYTRANDHIRTKMDTCVLASDYILDFIAEQNKVKLFLEDMDALRPGPEAPRLQRRAQTLPWETRDSLNRLYAVMQDFAQVPLTQLYKVQITKMEELAPLIQKLAQDNLEFCEDAAEKMGDEENGEKAALRVREEAMHKMLTQTKTSMRVAISNLPNLEAAHSWYLDSVRPRER